jgi:hypothetical protein
MVDHVSLLGDGELAALAGSVDPGLHARIPGPIAAAVKSGLNWLDSGFRAVLVMALVVELGIVLTEIGSRFLVHQSLLWADEAAKLFLSLTAFVGGALAYRARHS